ncbi:hypothetical protein D3C73_1506010 [compost metagenome]
MCTVQYDPRRTADLLEPSGPERIPEAFQQILVLQHEGHILAQNLQRHHGAGGVAQLMLAFHGDADFKLAERPLEAKALHTIIDSGQLIAEIFAGQIEG